jgi:hypothetical protein
MTELTASRKPIDKPPSRTRSRVSNGSAVLEGVDGRSAVARRYRDVLNELISDLGGDPSGAQSAIARRASALCVVCEQAEAEMVAGGALDLAEFTTAANSLRRLLSDLGLERRAKDITQALRNISPADSPSPWRAIPPPTNRLRGKHHEQEHSQATVSTIKAAPTDARPPARPDRSTAGKGPSRAASGPRQGQGHRQGREVIAMGVEAVLALAGAGLSAAG